MDVVDRLHEEWWQKTPVDSSMAQAKDYSERAFRAGYIAAREIVLSNSSPAPTPKIEEILTRDQRDALVAANIALAVLQRGHEGELFFDRIQKIVNEISDILYR